jgi:voltage-gated potassium channel
VAKKRYKLTTLEKRVDDWFEMPMLLVTLLLIFTLLVPILFELPTHWKVVFATANIIIWLTFYVELFVKLFIANNKYEAMKRNWSLLVIALAPLFTSLRFLRLSRLWSLVRFLRLQNYVDRAKEGLRQLVYNLEQIIITLLIFVFISAFLMWQVEVRFDGSIGSFADALWWSVITLTTIGYGDTVPTSSEGRIIGAIIGLLGAVLFMVFVARIASMFVQQNARKKA